jgi:HEPN domain-containing protein
MPLDRALAEDTKAWLVKANHDLRAAQILIDQNPPALGPAVYHCQQAAEKALKAFLTVHDKPFRKTHDLAELGRQCSEIDASLEEVAREVAPLTVYEWAFRYPGPDEEPTQHEASDALLKATQTIDEVTDRMPAEVRPDARDHVRQRGDDSTLKD